MPQQTHVRERERRVSAGACVGDECRFSVEFADARFSVVRRERWRNSDAAYVDAVRERASCAKNSIVDFVPAAPVGTTATKSVTPTFAYACILASIFASLPITATSAGAAAPPRSSVARYDGT